MKISLGAIAISLPLLLAPAALTAQTKVVCIGDSITEGWHGNPSFVPFLQKLLGSQYTLVNAGRSGATMLKAGDVPYWTQSQFTTALKSQANVIVIMLGTNDSKSKNWGTHSGEYKSDYLAMVDTLKKTNPNARIILALPPPAFSTSYGISNDVIKSQIPQIKDIASSKKLSVVDVNTPLLPFSKYFGDGVHPDSAGADTIAHVYQRAVLAATTGIGTRPTAPPSASRIHLAKHGSILEVEGIASRTGLATIRITGIDGREVLNRPIETAQGEQYSERIDPRAWPAGMYVIQLADASGLLGSVLVPIDPR